MISQKTRYALKALVLLAKDERAMKGPVLISELARRGNMPKKFLEAILLELKRHGILQSKKGKGGGYALAKPAETVRLGDVIRLFDGPLALIPCVAKSLNHRCRECTDEETTGLRVLFQEVRDSTAQILDGTSLAKVCKVQEELSAQRKPMYFI